MQWPTRVGVAAIGAELGKSCGHKVAAAHTSVVLQCFDKLVLRQESAGGFSEGEEGRGVQGERGMGKGVYMSGSEHRVSGSENSEGQWGLEPVTTRPCLTKR